jgi:hypothetical protein
VSWVDLGIVTGLVTLVAMLIVCMNMVYSNANESRQTPSRAAKGSVDGSKQTSATSRQVA